MIFQTLPSLFTRYWRSYFLPFLAIFIAATGIFLGSFLANIKTTTLSPNLTFHTSNAHLALRNTDTSYGELMSVLTSHEKVKNFYFNAYREMTLLHSQGAHTINSRLLPPASWSYPVINRGTFPQNAKEVSISHALAQKLALNIGDSLFLLHTPTTHTSSKKFVISAIHANTFLENTQQQSDIFLKDSNFFYGENWLNLSPHPSDEIEIALTDSKSITATIQELQARLSGTFLSLSELVKRNINQQQNTFKYLVATSNWLIAIPVLLSLLILAFSLNQQITTRRHEIRQLYIAGISYLRLFTLGILEFFLILISAILLACITSASIFRELFKVLNQATAGNPLYITPNFSLLRLGVTSLLVIIGIAILASIVIGIGLHKQYQHYTRSQPFTSLGLTINSASSTIFTTIFLIGSAIILYQCVISSENLLNIASLSQDASNFNLLATLALLLLAGFAIYLLCKSLTKKLLARVFPNTQIYSSSIPLSTYKTSKALLFSKLLVFSTVACLTAVSSANSYTTSAFNDFMVRLQPYDVLIQNNPENPARIDHTIYAKLLDLPQVSRALRLTPATGSITLPHSQGEQNTIHHFLLTDRISTNRYFQNSTHYFPYLANESFVGGASPQPQYPQVTSKVKVTAMPLGQRKVPSETTEFSGRVELAKSDLQFQILALNNVDNYETFTAQNAEEYLWLSLSETAKAELPQTIDTLLDTINSKPNNLRLEVQTSYPNNLFHNSLALIITLSLLVITALLGLGNLANQCITQKYQHQQTQKILISLGFTAEQLEQALIYRVIAKVALLVSMALIVGTYSGIYISHAHFLATENTNLAFLPASSSVLILLSAITFVGVWLKLRLALRKRIGNY